MPDMYALGVSDALARLGLSKFAEEESHLGRNLALAGLGAAGAGGLYALQRQRQQEQESDSNLLRNLGLGGLGTAATYALLRKVRLSGNPVLRAIQKASKGKLTGVDYSTRSPALQEAIGVKHPHAWMPDWLRRPVMKLTRGVDEVKLHQLTHEQLPERHQAIMDILQRRTPKKVPQQQIEGAAVNFGEPALGRHYRGDVTPTGNIEDALRLAADKHLEAQWLERVMPGLGPKPYGTVQDFLRSRARDPAKRIAQLQRKLQKAQPGGFIIKPRSAAATGDVIKSTDDLMELMHAPGQKGEWVREMLKRPEQFVVQESIPIATERRIPFFGRKQHAGRAEMPVEYRVHTVGGQIVPGATVRRYPTTGALNPFKTWRERRELTRQLQPHLDKLPAQQRDQMMMGMDVVRTPQGQFRVIETNPIGGQSGFLAPDITHAPTLAPHRVYRAITGRTSKPLAAATALGAGGTVAGTAAAADTLRD